MEVEARWAVDSNLRRDVGSDIEKEITIPFATSVVGGQHQVSLQRTKSKVDKIDVKIPAGIESGKKNSLEGGKVSPLEVLQATC